jgi:hypothetical protein
VPPGSLRAKSGLWLPIQTQKYQLSKNPIAFNCFGFEFKAFAKAAADFKNQ